MKAMSGSVVLLLTRGCVATHGQCYHQRPCGFLWSVLAPKAMSGFMILLQPEAMLMSISWAATKGYDGICSPLVSMANVSLETMLILMAYSVTKGYDGVHSLCCGIGQC